MKESAEKTEKPTARKKHESRKKGMGARSQELPQAISLLFAAAMLPVAIPRFLREMADSWTATLTAETVLEPGVATALLAHLTKSAALTMAPLVVFFTVASVIAQLALVGEKPNPYKLKPKISGISPKQGIKKVVSKQQIWELGKTMAKLGALTLVTIGVWRTGVSRLMDGPSPLATTLARSGDSLRQILSRTALLGLLIGIADAVISRRRFTKQMKMSKKEIKDEAKQSEGNPIIKGEIRRRQMKMSRSRMMAAIATADVVVTNPTHLAVALAYDPEESSPQVVAKGAGEVARRIREEARLHDVPIQENKPLARALFHSVEVDEYVPFELFRAVAEVLATVYRTRKARRS